MSEYIATLTDMDRAEAARLLRAARAARAAEADELIGWAFLAMPQSRPVLRLKIQQLLAQGDTVAADALIARGLLGRPADPALTFLRARSLHAQGRLADADREVRSVIEQRPRHAEVLVLAGRIARRRDDHARATELLERAIAQRPHDESLRKTLVQWLIDAGRLDAAETALAELTWPDDLLHARLLRAQGRQPDAADLLERSIDAAADLARRDSVLAELIEVLEATGDHARLRALVEPLEVTTPWALLAAARAMLRMGAFSDAVTATTTLAGDARWRRAAVPTLVAAAALDGRPDVARRALDQLPGGPQSLDGQAVAESWRRGLLGAMLVNQRSAGQAGADPTHSVLQPLLQEALRVFEAELGGPRSEADPTQTELEGHRTQCLAAMGRSMEAAASWARAERSTGAIGRVGPDGPSGPSSWKAA